MFFTYAIEYIWKIIRYANNRIHVRAVTAMSIMHLPRFMHSSKGRALWWPLGAVRGQERCKRPSKANRATLLWIEATAMHFTLCHPERPLY